MTIDKVRENYKDSVKVALLEQSIKNINSTLDRIEKRFDKVDERFDKMDKKFEDRFDKIDKRFDRIESDSWTHHRWTMTGIFGTYAVMISFLVTFIVKFTH